jgi:hypothetical protein
VLGRWLSDLEVGDVLGPYEHVVTPFLIREYAHAVEDSSELHQASEGLIGPPTMIQADKKYLFDRACPEGPGPAARLHLVYDASHRKVIRAGQEVSVIGEVSERYDHKGREHVIIEFEVRDKVTGEVFTTYRDTSLISYRQNP